MEPIETKARELVEQMRPYVQAEGADVVVTRFVEGRLYIKIDNTNPVSASSLLMLRMGIEKRLCEEIPELHSVDLD